MQGIGEWFGEILENVMEVIGGVAALVNGGLLIAHFLIGVTILEYWDKCGVLPGGISVLIWLLWLGSPVLTVVVQKGVAETVFDQFHNLVFAGLVAMIAAYDVWFFMAFVERGDAPIARVWDENFIHSGFCEFTRAILPSKI